MSNIVGYDTKPEYMVKPIFEHAHQWATDDFHMEYCLVCGAEKPTF
jgi:hypothetical protein